MAFLPYRSDDAWGLAPLMHFYCNFIIRTVRLSNKLCGQWYVKERLQSSFVIHMWILVNSMKPLCPESRITFWSMIICNETLHWSYTTLMCGLVTTVGSSPSLTVLLHRDTGFDRTFATGVACQQRKYRPPIQDVQVFNKKWQNKRNNALRQRKPPFPFLTYYQFRAFYSI